ncbi:uncharacterized protein LOC112177559 [Rosa chinensis]|uniref:uncharacterized protein LOC112177559 n=1 Tax=Rosa chinensis TaxID=74649 RepID=UPI000D08D7D7|nr:uncharacterized protein LOC112177559 [Rosa chinensis]
MFKYKGGARRHNTPICTNGIEDNVHVFLNCTYAQEIWRAAAIPRVQEDFIDLKDWLLQLATTLDKEKFAKVMMLIWGIWKNRNSQVWEGSKKHPCDVVLMTFGWLKDFAKANKLNTPQRTRNQVRVPPPQHWLKCNVDGAFVAQNGRSGDGVIFTDNYGQVRAAAVQPLQFIITPFHAELQALSEALQIATGMNYNKVIFEIDCALLAGAMNQDAVDMSMCSFLLDEMKERLQSHREFKVTFAPRETNHKLANRACNSHSQTWFGTAPEFIRDVILNECTR